MSDNITSFRGESLNGKLGFYIEYDAARDNFKFEEIPKFGPDKRNQPQGKTGKPDWLTKRDHFHYLWTVRVWTSKKGNRFIPIHLFDRFIGEAFAYPEISHLWNGILLIAEREFLYDPFKWTEV
jgi:hypothetical protein